MSIILYRNNKTLHDANVALYRKWNEKQNISKAEKGSLDERISFSNVLIDGNLASVWTLYEFYYKGQFSHCGVNSFQLVKSNNEWKIQYIIDTRRKDNCKK